MRPLAGRGLAGIGRPYRWVRRRLNPATWSPPLSGRGIQAFSREPGRKSRGEGPRQGVRFWTSAGPDLRGGSPPGPGRGIQAFSRESLNGPRAGWPPPLFPAPSLSPPEGGPPFGGCCP